MDWRDPYHVMQMLGINTTCGKGRYKNRHFRYLEREGVFQIGESDRDFDRWANSVEEEFEIHRKSEQRRFLKWSPP